MLDPSVEIINIQLCKIFECISAIQDGIFDTQLNCSDINGLLDQFEQLCQMHFMYEEQLLEWVDLPSVSEQKHLHELFLKAIGQLKSENDQCHTPFFCNSFIQLRLDFVSNMNKETMMLCDLVINKYS